MLNRKAHYWRRWRLTNKEEHKQAYKAYSVKCVQAIHAYYRECENALVQSDNLEKKFYQYVNGKISGRKSVPPISSLPVAVIPGKNSYKHKLYIV